MTSSTGATVPNGPWGGPNIPSQVKTGVIVPETMFGPPPTSLDIRVTAYANAGGYTVNATVNNGPVWATDGLNDAPTGNGITGSQSAGSHLFHKDNKQLAKVLTFPAISLNATASSTGSTYCTVSLQAVQDTRKVTISANVDATSKKVPLLDANGNQTKDANGDPNYTSAPNAPDASGTMYGDTIYSYHNYVTQPGPNPRAPVVVDVGTLNWIYFTPNFVGGWHWKAGTTHNGDSIAVPNVVVPDTWKWSPSESEDTWDYGKCSMPWAPNYTVTDTNASGQDSPKTYPVTYSATDNYDQVSATANYVMTVHDPSEQNYPDHESDVRTNYRQISGNLTSSALTDQLGGGLAVQIDYSLSASFGGSQGSWVAQTLGLNLTATVEEDFQTISTIVKSNVPPGWVTAVWEYDHYYDHVGKTDAWTTAGYGGTPPYYIREIPSVPNQQWGIVMGTPGPVNSTHP